ncbi:MAG: UDP-N-acetylmuramate--L-alanine ligase [Pirellulales bacterium]|nr:UDP-N-acetylmuramate--L-alanine ligase [Pirellulales bacterium]
MTPLQTVARRGAAILQAAEHPAASSSAHLIGAAGAGMRSLADVLVQRGWRLTGSDAGLLAPQVLSGSGVRVRPGHSPRNVPLDADVVIHSDALEAGNCELRRARRLGIPAISYPQTLAALMNGAARRDAAVASPCGVAIAGTHGKSTTTAMAATILIHAGLDPTVVLGAVPHGWTSGGRSGRGDLVLVEACEYRQNFLLLKPAVAVVLGIEPDHFDCFQSDEEVVAAFEQFARHLPGDGLLLASADCPTTRDVCRRTAKRAGAARLVTFGFHEGAKWRAVNLAAERGRYQFDIEVGGEHFASLRLAVPGRHNIANALAAAALAAELGMPAMVIREALESFTGLERRLETVGTFGGVTLVDDYAHHPSAVAATLAALREAHPAGRLFAVFEPHQASRMICCFEPFARSLLGADRVLVTEVFFAREQPAAADGQLAVELAARVRQLGGSAVAWERFEEVVEQLAAEARPGDTVVTLGAGDIRKVRHGLVQRLRRDS